MELPLQSHDDDSSLYEAKADDSDEKDELPDEDEKLPDRSITNFFLSSVADPDPNPDPDPQDSHVFGPPGSGSGSISQRYGSGSGSGSFYHQAKKVRKILIPTAL